MVKVLTTLLGLFLVFDLPAFAVARAGGGEEVFFVSFLATLGLLISCGFSEGEESDVCVIAATVNLLLIPVLCWLV